MKKLLLILITVFLMSSVSSGESIVDTNNLIRIDNVIEAKLESEPKTIIYRKHKNGESTIYIKFKKVEEGKVNE